MVTVREFAGATIGAVAGAAVGYYGLQGVGDAFTNGLGSSPYAHIQEVAEYTRYALQYGAPALLGGCIGQYLFRGRTRDENDNNNGRPPARRERDRHDDPAAEYHEEYERTERYNREWRIR